MPNPGATRFILCLAACTAFAQKSTDPVIEKARTAAANYAKSLPDYIATRTTTRFRGARAGHATNFGVGESAALLPAYTGMNVSAWQVTDTVAAQVTSEHGTEVYSEIRVNGNVVPTLPAGIWSAGEFSGLDLGILHPNNAAFFSHPKPERIRDHASTRYEFTVDQRHSEWTLEAGVRGSDQKAHYNPAFEGSIWIDPATGGVLRIERTATAVTGRFPLDAVKATTDYDRVAIGDTTFLLPVRSETITCLRDTPRCYKNQTVLENYSKFEAKSTIEFK